MPDIRFSFQALTAGSHEVGIAGDFTDWEILDLDSIGGMYLLTLPVESGKHRYKLIVDGIWMPDPANPMREPDPFGGMNSILVVSAEEVPEPSWDEVYGNLSLLQERLERYLWLNRYQEDGYELRFDWYPSLKGVLTSLIDGIEYPMYHLGAHANRDVYHCMFQVSSSEVDIVVRIADKDKELYYGAFGFCDNLDATKPHHIKLSELPLFMVPDWVPQGVIYQILPDRFCNGDPKLNPDFSEWYYEDCSMPPHPGELLKPQQEYYHLVKDWNDISGLSQNPYLEEGKPDWWSFYGGDIPGILSKLDYLANLGVSIIYFNPLWQAKSNHKYDAADFRRIDPHFGSTAQMVELVRALHQKGIKVILDVAFNHTGETFWAFRDCVEKGERSLYWNWYDWHQWPLPKPLPRDFKPKDYYQCWWGIKDMPDLNYDLSRTHPSENYVKDIRKAIPNAPLVDYILESVSWWLRDIGIDGFRLDVPDEVPYWFWQLFRTHVKSVKPEAWIVGEIWNNAQGWVNHHYFDSVMNYAYFKNPVLEFFICGIIKAERFRELIEEGLALYPVQALRAMMNLLGSHDTWRILELAEGNVGRLKLALLFQFTFIGTPHIYYGDEIALRGKKDPDNRRPFNWDWEQDEKARDLRGFYQELIRLRRSDNLFTEGEFRFLDTEEGLLAYERYLDARRLIIVINHQDREKRYSIQRIGEVLLLTGGARATESGLTFNGRGAAVLCQSSGCGQETISLSTN